ncbi:MAG: hypothetical protein OJI74_16435 [Rhodanobacter thiooxydans]|nr:hypothetical protein [Rhodanobacter thiooxydans]
MDMVSSLQTRLQEGFGIRGRPGALNTRRRARTGRKAHQIDRAAIGARVQVLTVDQHTPRQAPCHAQCLQALLARLGFNVDLADLQSAIRGGEPVS